MQLGIFIDRAYYRATEHHVNYSETEEISTFLKKIYEIFFLSEWLELKVAFRGFEYDFP